jgi:anaerobic selenocysteine-containing dehydrogenase
MAGVKMKAFFHSEGRQLASLRKMNPDPQVEIHPDTAANLGIDEGDWVWIETQAARVKMRAKFLDGIASDVVSAQHGWWFPEEAPPEYGWKKSSANLLFGDTDYDPDTGSESLGNGLCRIYPVSDNIGEGDRMHHQ